MVSLSRCVGSAALLLTGIEAARVRRKHDAQADSRLVLFKEGTTTSDIREFCNGQCELMGDPDAGGVAFAQVFLGAATQMMNSAQANQVVDFEPDALDELIPEIDVKEDVEIASIESTESTESWGLERVGVPAAEFTGKGQTIYVVDTGVRVTHRDFGGRAFAGIDLTSGEGVEVCDPASLTCAADRNGHGTHCAGTAAGTTFGVAPQAKVIAVKTMSDKGSSPRSRIIATLDWIATKGVRPSVISMSIGGGSGRTAAYEEAINAATAAGMVVVLAAGNKQNPACIFDLTWIETAIKVGATTKRNKRAEYSNYGSCVDIMAPGSDIISASKKSDTGRDKLSGTSMACPHVSGAVALILESNPSLNRDQILQVMLDSSAKDMIKELRRNDPHEFLWVGATPPPAFTPVPPRTCPWYCNGLCIASACRANCPDCPGEPLIDRSPAKPEQG